MKYTAAISDADILIHLLRTNHLVIIEKLFDRVIIPKYVLENEVKKKHYVSYEKLKEIIDDPCSIFEVQDKDTDREIRQIVNLILKDLKDIIGPGESHAAGYATAFGAEIIISDNYTEFKWIPNYITLTYHELLALHVHFNHMTFVEASHRYDIINAALDRPSSVNFITRQKRAFQRFQQNNWCKSLGIES
jgi:predicted nucleic acid-binding protein